MARTIPSGIVLDRLYALPDENLKRVGNEMALHVLAYNLKRVISIMGIAPLIAAMKAA